MLRSTAPTQKGLEFRSGVFRPDAEFRFFLAGSDTEVLSIFMHAVDLPIRIGNNKVNGLTIGSIRCGHWQGQEGSGSEGRC